MHRPVAALIAAVLALFLTPSRAQADLYTYNFSGTFISTIDSISSVHGRFTLDTVANSLSAWDFTLAYRSRRSTERRRLCNCR
jgi:hypothetical protein